MRDHPEASAASSSIRYYRRPTPSPGIAERTRRLPQPLPGLRGRDGLQRRPSASRRDVHPTGQQIEAEPLTTIVSDPARAKTSKSSSTRALVDWLRNQNYAVLLLRPRRTGSMARHRPPRFHRGDRQGSVDGPAIRSGCPCPRYGLSYGVSCREDYPFATPADLVRPVGKRFRTTRLRCKARVSAAGHILIKTAATSGRSPPPQRQCISPSQAAFRRSSSPQLRYVDVACWAEAAARPCPRQPSSASRHRALRRPLIALRSVGGRILPR